MKSISIWGFILIVHDVVEVVLHCQLHPGYHTKPVETLWLFVTSALPTAHVQYLGANMATDRGGGGGRGEGKGGGEEELVALTKGKRRRRGGGGGPPCPRGTDAVTWERIRVYMQECVRLCGALGSSVTREMDVLASSESLQLVERLRKRCLGSHPVRGEFASVLPWHRSGSWPWRLCEWVRACVCVWEKESECGCPLVWVQVFVCWRLRVFPFTS